MNTTTTTSSQSPIEQAIMNHVGFNIEEAEKYFETVCPPCHLSAHMADAKARLIDLLNVIDKAHLKADAVNIIDNFRNINASLSLAFRFFTMIDLLNIMEDEA